ncbi:MarR family winged helix-turn-helix transcriptional regulator [Cellulomonas sp. McL0617]|uniref:MarR family winged helix-turn-helix transcriptional regulator n=1 Tax=Cellulomonas sp. McL0617 TaxID=3415675 RepID=UPI003CF60D35
MTQPEDTALVEAEALRLSAGRFVRHVRSTVGQIPPGQAAVLGYLDRDGRLAITELAERERVRHQSMARTVKLLAEQGMVDLTPDDVDRRRVIVAITSPGRDRLEQQRHDRSSVIAAAIQDLTPEQRAVLRSVPAVLDALTERVLAGR